MSSTNLSMLIAAGALAKVETVKKNVTWKHENDAGEIIEDNFDVFIKLEPSAYDFEFIHLNKKENSPVIARRVARMIRLGENGEEEIPYETALTMQPSLLVALCLAINDVEKEKKGAKNEDTPKEGEEVKN